MFDDDGRWDVRWGERRSFETDLLSWGVVYVLLGGEEGTTTLEKEVTRARAEVNVGEKAATMKK